MHRKAHYPAPAGRLSGAVESKGLLPRTLVAETCSIMKTAAAILITGLLAPLGLAQQSAREAWASLADQKKRKSNPFAFVENRKGLPNVLIYGDSISIQYMEPLRKELQGKANVYRLHRNGGDSSAFITNMKSRRSKGN